MNKPDEDFDDEDEYEDDQGYDGMAEGDRGNKDDRTNNGEAKGEDGNDAGIRIVADATATTMTKTTAVPKKTGRTTTRQKERKKILQV